MQAYEIVAKRVKEIGITNAELARRCDIDPELLRRSLIGERRLIADEFVALVTNLGMSLTDFRKVFDEQKHTTD